MSELIALSALGPQPLDLAVTEIRLLQAGRNKGKLSEFRINGAMLTIGSKPIPDPIVKLQKLRSNLALIAHHNVPFGDSGLVNNNSVDLMIERCHALDIMRYSQHPPPKRDYPTWDSFLDWYYERSAKYTVNSMLFGLETMYPIKHGGNEQECWLSSPEETFRFAEELKDAWTRPIVLDVSHMHIADWNIEEVQEFADRYSNLIGEVHYSRNNGKRDLHFVLRDHKPEIDYLTVLRERLSRLDGIYWVDEGRRDRN